MEPGEALKQRTIFKSGGATVAAAVKGIVFVLVITVIVTYTSWEWDSYAMVDEDDNQDNPLYDLVRVLSPRSFKNESKLTYSWTEEGGGQFGTGSQKYMGHAAILACFGTFILFKAVKHILIEVMLRYEGGLGVAEHLLTIKLTFLSHDFLTKFWTMVFAIASIWYVTQSG